MAGLWSQATWQDYQAGESLLGRLLCELQGFIGMQQFLYPRGEGQCHFHAHTPVEGATLLQMPNPSTDCCCRSAKDSHVPPRVRGARTSEASPV